ncbi:uncharacterized protein LOC132948063 [Metopolophium dirhodum]|uniref:uncharacterized protein LOC132948063 n=1 Tax=Metopolophium dirhodum TaxID=44670 RepID=UPI00298F6C4A|nr:uncharacterized protein LOC132948063 [Metopolophium dirhodum]
MLTVLISSVIRCIDPLKSEEAKDLLLNEIELNWEFQTETNIQAIELNQHVEEDYFLFIEELVSNQPNGEVEHDLEVLLEKRIWTRPWILRRKERGSSALLLEELRCEDIGEFKSILRMSPDIFDILLSCVAPKIQRMNTIMREAIPAKVKLEITLDFLSSGINYRKLSHFYRVSRSSICKFIPEVCVEIYKALKENIKLPINNEEWAEIENGFKNRWNFPLCYGAIDGKHIQIVAPDNSGSIYFNYKKVFSIVLLAIVDDDYCFRYIDVGACGMASDGSVFRNCSIYNKLENNLLPNGGVIVADGAFPLKPYMMKPYLTQVTI